MDIVERLRKLAERERPYGSLPDVMDQAADEIERLREYNDAIETRYWEFAPKYDSLLIENQRLREALQKCDEAMTWELGGEPLDTLMIEARAIARSALQQKDTE